MKLVWGSQEFLTFQDKQKYLMSFQEQTLKCGFLEKRQRSQGISEGSVSLQKASQQVCFARCLFIHHACLGNHFVCLVRAYYHHRNIIEHCFLLPGPLAALPLKPQQAMLAHCILACLWSRHGHLLLCVMVMCPSSSHRPSVSQQSTRDSPVSCPCPLPFWPGLWQN